MLFFVAFCQCVTCNVKLALHGVLTGYKSFKGQVLDSTDLSDIIGGLRENGLLVNYSHILTGKENQ